MKRTLLLSAIFCILAGAVGAQQIRTSPFEGRWVWDEKGNGDPDIIELVFFGNVMLGMNDEALPVYMGTTFTHTGRTITFGNGFDEWEYQLSGNTLTLSSEYNEHLSYTKTVMEKSPLEGIWKVTGGTGYDSDDEYYLLFAGDIMAAGSDSEYAGFKIEFSGKTFHPSRSYLVDGVSEKQLREATMEYKMSGRSLTITISEGSEVILTKAY